MPPANTQPKRLLFVVNEAYFFMTHRLALARAAKAAGFEVHVAAPRDHIWAPVDFSLDQLTDAGFTYHPINLSRRGKNPLLDFRTALDIYRLFRRLRPDLIHLLTIKPLIYGGIAARLAGLPAVVCTVTGLGQIFVDSGCSAALLRHLIVRLYRLATHHPNIRVIVQNRGDMDLLRRVAAVPPESLRLIRGSGVNLAWFAALPEAAEPPLVILPARLIWEKGIGPFVEAARKIKARGVAARFALVGDAHPSNPRAVPEADIRAWVDEGIVEWWGRRTDMPAVYGQCALVCLPSSYGEGVPKVLIEAAAASRPIVATDIAGCREIVSDGDNGLLAPPGDSAALVDRLERLISDRELRQTMGRRGREIAEREFSEETVVAQTLAVYGEVDASAPSSSASRSS